MSFFSKKNKYSYKLFISLKSSSIDFQLAQINESNHREVLLVDRNIILLENSQNSEIYTNQYKAELKKMLSKNKLQIDKLVLQSDLEVCFVLYSPWFTSRIESLAPAGSVLIDQKFLDTNLHTLTHDSKLQIIEKKVIKIQANGYTLTDFIKTKSTNIKMNVYTSSIAKTIYDIFRKNVQDIFPNVESITFNTSPVLFLDRIKEFIIHEDNLVSIYVGGEITEVSIIKDDSLVYFATFPIGKHDFLRSIQDNIKTFDYDLLFQKQIKIKSEAQQKQFDEYKKKWAESMYNVFTNFDQQIPSKMLIMSDNHTKPFFTELLTNSIQKNVNSKFKNHRIINFDILSFKDIISYKTPSGEQEIDLILEALI